MYARISEGDCYELGDIDNQNFWTYCYGPLAATNTGEAILEGDSRQYLGLPDVGTVTFRGLGITEQTKGYEPMGNLWYDFIDMTKNGGYLASAGSPYYDSGDYPYDDDPVYWESYCGGPTNCP